MRLTARDILLMYDFTIDATAIGEESQDQFNKIPWLLKQPFFQKQVRRMVRPDILGPRFNVDQPLLQSLVERGYPIIVWTVDDLKTADDLFKMGIHGVQTNKPLQLFDSLSRTNQIVRDAGGTCSKVCEIIYIRNVQNVVNAIAKATAKKKSITIAGRRHSMGGQTVLNDSIHLNMMGLDDVFYNPDSLTVTVGAGATWAKIQKILDRYNRSIKVMQSDNIFTVGGSISVNVHGWQVDAPPIASTIKSLKVVGADRVIRQVSRDQHQALFGLVIGGYGLFGVIIEAELDTVPNTNLSFQAEYMDPEAFTEMFQQHVANNPNAALAYGRLSVDKARLFEEAGLFWYDAKSSSKIEMIKEESFIALKRSVFRSSQYAQFGKRLRWVAEKMYANHIINLKTISRNNAMHADIHILWPLYGQIKDILHEYFVPKNALAKFLKALKKHILDFDMNILNVTIREVCQDNISLLPYAKQDMFGVVCFFSQKQGIEDELKMQIFSSKIIDKVIKLNGTFYLPYRLHYGKQQILNAYPEILDWINFKKKWDPEGIFNNQFFQYIHTLMA